MIIIARANNTCHKADRLWVRKPSLPWILPGGDGGADGDGGDDHDGDNHHWLYWLLLVMITIDFIDYF